MVTPIRCPKCDRPLPDWVDLEDEDPPQWARVCANEGTCTYVACDDVACRAPAVPITGEDWRLAAEHWQRHRLMGGCSHGH